MYIVVYHLFSEPIVANAPPLFPSIPSIPCIPCIPSTPCISLHPLFPRSGQTAMRFVNNKSVGGYSPLPFACMLTNSLIWMLYGSLLQDFVVWVPNSVGVVVALGCISAYQSVSCALHLATYLPVGLACCFALFCAYSGDLQSLGLLGCVSSALTVGAPLVTLRTVIAEKSTGSLSFPVTMVSFFNHTSWSLYGVMVAGDPMVSSHSLAEIVHR